MTPQLILNRTIFDDVSTIGELDVDRGLFKCNTLEDTVRRVKKFGETAIPAGLYRVALITSPHFGFVPHILDVPYFEDILIHAGNSAKDTKGCPLVGKYDANLKDWVGGSRTTHRDLMEILVPMSKKEDLWIQINGGIQIADFHPENWIG